MRYIVQRGEQNRVAVIAQAKDFENFSLRVFNLWEHISHLDGVNAESIRNVVIITSVCKAVVLMRNNRVAFPFLGLCSRRSRTSPDGRHFRDYIRA